MYTFLLLSRLISVMECCALFLLVEDAIFYRDPLRSLRTPILICIMKRIDRPPPPKCRGATPSRPAPRLAQGASGTCWRTPTRPAFDVLRRACPVPAPSCRMAALIYQKPLPEGSPAVAGTAGGVTGNGKRFEGGAADKTRRRWTTSDTQLVMCTRSRSIWP